MLSYLYNIYDKNLVPKKEVATGSDWISGDNNVGGYFKLWWDI
jgi:hypothetical protein